MTLEKHVVDTLKEWQIKIGNFDSGIRLYYPKLSLCRHLHLDSDIDNKILARYIENYFADNVKYLGDIRVCVLQEKFCILVDKEGCKYVEKKVPEPEFLANFLEVLKTQKMSAILEYFEEYARRRGTRVCVNKEESGLETVLYFEDENIEPYIYCIDQNEFGITYHRFTQDDYIDLQSMT